MGSKKKNKEEKNGPPLFSEGDEGGGGLNGMRAREAKGPFPGGKRVGSWGKKKKSKAHGLRSMRILFLNDASQKENPIHFNEVDGERFV